MSFAKLPIAVLILLARFLAIHGYRSDAPSFARQRQSQQRLSAWTLPSPETLAQSFSGGPTWYNEYKPTARRTVYDDAPMEYTFVTPFGEDWPMLYDEEQASSPQRPRRVPKALRRAAKWASKRVRRRTTPLPPSSL